jgi:hypothetical protein
VTGINISIGSDEKDFLRGVKNSATATDDLADALKDVDKAGSKAGDQLEHDFKAAQKATKNFNDSVKDGEDALRKTATVAKTTTRDISDDYELSAREQKKLRKEAIKEIGSEAKANAAETFSSFDGSAQSFVDGIQGTLGGLVSSLGPVGLALGAAGALAIGLINGALLNADTTSAAFKQSVGELTAELIKSGQVGTVSLGYIVSELQKLATESDSGKVSLSKLDATATKADSSFRDLAQAYAGNTKGLKDQVKAGKEKLEQDQLAAEALGKLTVEQQKATDGDETAYAAALKRAQGQKDVNNYLEQAAAKAAEAAKQEKLYVDAGGPELERKAALIDQINTAYDDAAGSVDDFINKETGVFDVAKYITSMQAREQALRDYQTTLATSGLSDSARDFLNAQGEQAAATLLQGYKNGSADQKAALAAIWAEAGKTSSGSFVATAQNGISKWAPATVTVPAQLGPVNTSSLANLPKSVRIQIEGVTRNGLKLF